MSSIKQIKEKDNKTRLPGSFCQNWLLHESQEVIAKIDSYMNPRKLLLKLALTWISGSYCQNWLLHESQEVIAKIEFDITSELANLNIDGTVQKRRELYTKHKSYEKVLARRRTDKWRKVKYQEKEKIMLVLNETSSSKNTKILIHQV